MRPTVLRSAEFSVQPWKNGGGTTTEIAAHPPGAGFDAFDWRISMARVDAAGPFSMFHGIDRSIGLLDGRGIDLHLAKRGAVALDMMSAPYAFPGDVPVSATLRDGPILDLNIMTRRGRWRHHLSRMSAVGTFELAQRGDVTVALLRGASATVSCSGHAPERCDHGDAIVLDDSISLTVILGRPAELWIADLWSC